MNARFAAIGLLTTVLAVGGGMVGVARNAQTPDIVDAVTRGDLGRVKELVQQGHSPVPLR